jgi:glucose/arabinose dehydrogenase
MKLRALSNRFMGRKPVRSTILTVSLFFGPIFLFSAASWGAVTIKAEPMVTGLSSPVDITHAGDGSGRLFIILQGGRTVIFDGVQILSPPFLDIASLVSSGGERGLLGAAFHPNYVGNGFFYLSYTDTAGDSVIARYSVSLDPNRADPTSGVILLTIPQPFSNHNGGQLHFGPDGYLYIGIGDGGSGGDPQNNGQDLGTLLGKILRIDVDSGFPFTVPPDNPFVGVVGAREEIWSFGLRNPWRFSFDRLTGDLFIGDVGQNSWEEVDFQPANSTGGENYGWRLMEGNSCFNPAINCNNGTLTLPILVYDHSVGCSVTGGYLYRGSKNPNLNGLYLYGDFCSGLIWGAQEDGLGGWNTTVLLDTNFSISTFGEDESGEIYFAHLSATDGTIYQVVQSTSSTNSASTSSGGGGGGGAVGCFITTAVHGSQEVMGVWARFVLNLLSPFRNLII